MARRGLCFHCGLPLRGAARAEGEKSFCCYGCLIAFKIWSGGSGDGGGGGRSDEGEGEGVPGSSHAGGILGRMMLSVFFALASMMFSMTLYASAFYPAERGSAHALGPLAPVCQWLAFAFAIPVLPLLGWPLAAASFGLSSARVVEGSGARWVNALIAVGVLASFGLSIANLLRGEGEVYFETGVVILVLVTLGRYLDARARHRAAGSLRELLGAETEWAFRLDLDRPGREPDRVPLAEVRRGDRLRCLAGERVPADGEVLSGAAAVDEALITGEAEPRAVARGDSLHAGSILVDGRVEIAVLRAAGDRLLDRMAEAVESARERRMPLELVSETVSRWFLPAALAVAAGTVLSWRGSAGWGPATLNGLAVLLVSCPCALGIATPLAAWTAVGRAARRGVLVRGGEVFERLARGGSLFFDKTGTLTSSRLEVSRVVPSPGESEDEVLCAAASLAALSRHPTCEAIRRRAEERRIAPEPVDEFSAWPGLGLSGEVGGERVLAGSRRFVERDLARSSRAALRGGSADSLEDPSRSLGGPAQSPGGLSDSLEGPSESAVLIARGERIVGTVLCREELRPEARDVLAAAARRGFELAVLTGDSARKKESLEAALGIPVEAGLLPEDKVERLECARRRGRTVVMVGDGVNDAPVLAAAEVGIALGSGAEITRETADVILLDRGGEPLRGLADLLDLSRETVRRIRFNLFWAFTYNVLGIGLAAAGWIHPVIAAVLMIVSSLFVVAGSRL